MKLSIQKSNAIGELVVVETEDPAEFGEAFRVADQRMVEMNNRIIVATAIQRRYGGEVWEAVREVMDTMFGNRPITQQDMVAALESQRLAAANGATDGEGHR